MHRARGNISQGLKVLEDTLASEAVQRDFEDEVKLDM